MADAMDKMASGKKADPFMEMIAKKKETGKKKMTGKKKKG